MFNCQQIWKINHILVGVVMKRNIVVNTAVQSGPCIILIFKNIQKYWMFPLFTLNTMKARQTNKTWQWQLTKSYLELASNLKKQHLYKVCTKSASKNSPNFLLCHILLFSMSGKSSLTCTTTRSSLTNN